VGSSTLGGEGRLALELLVGSGAWPPCAIILACLVRIVEAEGVCDALRVPLVGFELLLTEIRKMMRERQINDRNVR
jgi:hypothetical protein